MKKLLLSIVLLFTSCESGIIENKKYYNNQDSRKQYAKELNRDTRVSTLGTFEATETDNKTLFVHSSSINQAACEAFSKGEYVKNAVKIGFNKLTCRNELNIEQWSFPLN